MAKYELSENVVKNIMEFIDRAPIKGLKEIQAVNEVLYLLSNPIIDEVVEEEPKI